MTGTTIDLGTLDYEDEIKNINSIVRYGSHSQATYMFAYDRLRKLNHIRVLKDAAMKALGIRVVPPKINEDNRILAEQVVAALGCDPDIVTRSNQLPGEWPFCVMFHTEYNALELIQSQSLPATQYSVLPGDKSYLMIMCKDLSWLWYGKLLDQDALKENLLVVSYL